MRRFHAHLLLLMSAEVLPGSLLELSAKAVDLPLRRRLVGVGRGGDGDGDDPPRALWRGRLDGDDVTGAHAIVANAVAVHHGGGGSE